MKLKLLILIPALFILFGCKEAAPDPIDYNLGHDISEYHLKKKISKNKALKLVRSIDLFESKIDYELTSSLYVKEETDEMFNNVSKVITRVNFDGIDDKTALKYSKIYYEQNIYIPYLTIGTVDMSDYPKKTIQIIERSVGLLKSSIDTTINKIFHYESDIEKSCNIEQRILIGVDCSEVIAGKMRNGRTIVQFKHYTIDNSPFSTNNHFDGSDYSEYDYNTFIKRLVFYEGKLEYFVSSKTTDITNPLNTYTMVEIKYNQPIILPEWYIKYDWD